jgi:Xaa-Pro dipeptidase
MDRRAFMKTTAAGALLPLAVSKKLHALPLAGPPGEAAPDSGRQVPLAGPRVKELRDRIKPITPGERLERLENARKIMAEQKIDALLMEGGTTMTYFTGVNWGRSERLFAMVLPAKGEPVFCAPKFEEDRAREQVGDGKLLTWEEHESPFALVGDILRGGAMAAGTIGVEETTRYFVTDNVSKAVASASLVSGTPVTAGCRSVKSPHEIELMQIANDITAEVFSGCLATLKDGLTEREFGSTLTKMFSEYGVGGGALVLFGEASAYPHGLVKEHSLREGQIVLIDGGCSVEGYASDVTRTTVFGKASEKMKTVWGIVRKAQDAGLAAARPGVPGEDIDAAARRVVSAAGYGPDYKYFSHRLGHGIGMEGHEWYYLVRGNKRPERAGNMHSNEPGIYIVGEFGIRLEDEMLITEGGAKLLLPQAESLEKIFP